ncbi:hypothetical protein CC78DRAFT_566931 [Lojkania enalia]|uniref:FAD-binding FR-type domain-containing protein n=1 Tax=Lojkania enalia TaxID=147567 RepID=A0A9P4N8S2_9PLEO|nr:hypothetical protein CC78DRAFT_566931 [Didymosphaeria enalia]
MTVEIDDLDGIRHQRHLRHRTESDKRLVYFIWTVPLALIAARVAQRAFSRWNRQSYASLRRVQPVHYVPWSITKRIATFYQALWIFPVSILPGSRPSFFIGHLFAVAAYACIIGLLIVSVDTPRFSPHFIDDVAFRAAWTSLAQIPLVYLLATKRGPVNLLAHISYNRINWAHKWAGKILFLSTTVHVAIMKYSISNADIIRSSNKVIFVRYGLSAYGLLVWIALASILPLQRWNYHVFHVNHWISTLVFLWILLKHVPNYARFPIYIAAAISAADQYSCAYMFWKNNIYISTRKKRFRGLVNQRRCDSSSIGHPVKMTMPIQSPIPVNSDKLEAVTTIVRICNVPFSWKPGQHIRLYIPRLGIMEMHPLTSATCPFGVESPTYMTGADDLEDHRLLPKHTQKLVNDMVLMIRSRSGITRRLARYHQNWLSFPCPNSSRPSPSLTAYVSGPFGFPPRWAEYENIVLLATSTGVSFTLSILDHLKHTCVESRNQLRTQRIHFLWANRHVEPDFEATVKEMLLQHCAVLEEAGITITAEFYITCIKANIDSNSWSGLREYDQFAHLRRPRRKRFADKPLLRLWINEAQIIEDECLPSRSSLESDVSSTLIEEDVPSSEIHEEGRRWFRIPSFRLLNRGSSGTMSCSCRLKETILRSKSITNTFDEISRTVGSRPCVPDIVQDFVLRRDEGPTMIATCLNSEITAQVKTQVAKFGVQYALGQRKQEINLFTESFT